MAIHDRCPLKARDRQAANGNGIQINYYARNEVRCIDLRLFNEYLLPPNGHDLASDVDISYAFHHRR